jgi:hypothetical protein
MIPVELVQKEDVLLRSAIARFVIFVFFRSLPSRRLHKIANLSESSPTYGMYLRMRKKNHETKPNANECSERFSRYFQVVEVEAG